ncbi:MAG: hypothetical protein NTW30_00260 [Candidatus Aenigmarchaeota archaeon]|nr:hypothetical protein [Candidatus Aenigmarchaeota archaeon]
MAGILRHFFIAFILSFLLFFLLKGNVQFFQLILFLIGNMIPDLIFVPFFVLKYKTLDAEKIIKKKEWKFACRWDEIIMFIVALSFTFLFFSYETLMFLFGVITHIIIDLFVLEENVWW